MKILMFFMLCISSLEGRAVELKLNTNGFLNFAYGKHDYRNAIRPTYQRFTERSRVVESSAGVSLTTNIDNHWSAKIQFLGQFDGTTSSDMTSLDIYQVAYDLNSRLRFRVGRLRLATWLYSEVIQIGGLYPWLIPPAEVYDKNPIDSFNGGMASYLIPVANSYDINIDLYFGSEKRKINSQGQDVNLDGTDLVGVNLNFGSENLKIKYSYLKAFLEGSVETTSINSSTGVQTTVQAPFNLKDISLQSYGFKLEQLDFLVLYENVKTLSDSDAYKVSDAHYLSLGHYFSDRKFLALITAAEDLGHKSQVYPSKEESISLDINYYISSNIVLKSMLKKVHINTKSSTYLGQPVNRSQNFELNPNRDFNVFGMGLNIIF